MDWADRIGSRVRLRDLHIVMAVAEALKASMKKNGAVELRPSDLSRLENVIFEKNAGPRGHATVHRKFVGKDASVILRELGISAGLEARCILVEVPNDHPLVWTEQLMPILPVTSVRDVDAAIELAVQAEGGNRHTAAMHSTHVGNLTKMGRAMQCSII